MKVGYILLLVQPQRRAKRNTNNGGKVPVTLPGKSCSTSTPAANGINYVAGNK